MAAARDSDIALWLYNKLGTSSDTWSEGSICSQLNIDVLRNIKECFMDLPTQIKLKLLLSFFHIPKRNVEEWHTELEEIIEVAVVDSDPWVAMIAEIIKTYPALGSLNLEIREHREQGDSQRIVHDLTAELRRVVKKHSEVGLLPMECSYLNRTAFLAIAPQQCGNPKHFNLKRKPKAAALRAELVSKSGDAQVNVKKSHLPTVPVRSRGLPRNTDAMPMRGIPRTMSVAGMLRTSQHTPSRPRPPLTARRKDGGIKLLDIKDSPIALQQARKRRKLQDAAESKAAEAEAKARKQQQQQEAPAAAAAAAAASAQAATAAQQQLDRQAAVDASAHGVVDAVTSVPQEELIPLEPVSTMSGTVTTATPDCAAGLTPSNPPTPGGPQAPQATPILAAGTVATAAALHVGGSVQLPAGTIISRQSMQQQSPVVAVSAASPRPQQQSSVVTLPGLGPNQRIILAQGPGGQEQKIILANAPGGGEQRIILANAPGGVGGEQRFLLAAPTASGEQRVILTTTPGGVGGGEQRLVLAGGGEQRILLAPAAGGGEPRLILTNTGAGGEQRIITQGTVLQQSVGGQTLVYRTLAPAQTYATAQSVEAQQQADAGQPQYATLQPVQPEMLYTLGNIPGNEAASSPVHQQQVIGVAAQQQQVTQQQHQQQTTVTVLQPTTTTVQHQSPVQVQQQQQQQQVQVVAAPQQQQQQKRNLSLTREQMLEAQEMFRTSNKVTRPEKALILGFMAGSRDNPCPHLGNIVTIKLSEGEETVSQPGGSFISMLAETHFQMNYNTGEWRRIKKYRTLPVDQQAAT